MKKTVLLATMFCATANAAEEHAYHWTWPVRAGAYDLGTATETSVITTDFDRDSGNFAVRSARYSVDFALQLPQSRSYVKTEQVWVQGSFPDPGHWEDVARLYSISYSWSSSPPRDFAIDYTPVANVQQKFVKSLPQGGWESSAPVLFRQSGTPSELDFSFIENLSVDGKIISSETFDLLSKPSTRYLVAPIRAGWQYVSDDLAVIHNTVGPGLYNSDQWSGLPFRGHLDQPNLLCTYAPSLGKSGDLDLNRSVEFTDFVVLAENFGLRGSWENGDLDCNGSVQFADFAILAANYGASSAVTIPEPAGYMLAVFAVLAALRYARERRDNI